MKKSLLLVLTVLGFIIPNIYLLKVTFETGNILLWTNPAATVAGAFANDISTAFLYDLLCVVAVFFYYTHHQARQHGIKGVWRIWALTLLFGMAGPFPLFLYMIERKKRTAAQ